MSYEVRDPSTWNVASTAADMRSEMNRQRFQQSTREREENDYRTGPPAVPKERAWSLGQAARSPLGMALIAFAIVFGALVWINPPLVQRAPKNALDMPSADLWMVAAWAGVVALLVAISPYAARYLSVGEDDEGERESRRHRHRHRHRSMPEYY